MSRLNSITIGDYIDTLTDYHANGSYEILKKNVTLKNEPDYAIMIRTLNFERKDFKEDLIYLNETEYNYLTKTKVFPGDIIMNKIANPGNVYLMPDIGKPVSLAMNLFLIRFNEKINQKFMYYLMHQNENYIKLFANGTTTLTITKDSVRGLKFKVPTLEKQNQIAKVLSDLDAKIELNNKINAELEAMAKLIYDYWFVQFDFPNEQGKPYKSSGGKMVYNEQLKREIPEGWEVKTVGELLIKYSDKSIRIDSKNILKKGKHPVITQDNGDFIAGFTNEENPIADIPLIVFGDHSCTLRYIDFSFFRGADGTQLMYFSQNLTIYIYLFLQKVINQITGYGKYERHFKYLKDFKVVVPESNCLENFQSKTKPIFDKISHARFENLQLASLRDWLLPMLMNGQVTVKEAEAKVSDLGMVAEPLMKEE